MGVDISEQMLLKARSIDEKGSYYRVKNGELNQFKTGTYDLVFSAFTFDNIPTVKEKSDNLIELHRILKPDGIMINMVSSPEIYLHEWASFSTKDFPENHEAKNGEVVKTIMKDVPDKRPIDDILCDHAAYSELYEQAGFKVVKTHKPLAKSEEPFDWITETEIAPWVIYILKK